MKTPTLLPALFLLAACASEPQRFDPISIERHIAFLADDALEGRDSGTPGGDRAEEYIRAQLFEAGLASVQPLEFEFAAGATLGSASAMTVDSASIAADSFRPYAFSAPGAAAGDAVFAGWGVSSGELAHDDYAGLDAKDWVVIVRSGSPDGDPHGKFAAHASVRAKALKAKERGAIALIVLVDELSPFDGEGASQDVGLVVIGVLSSRAGAALGLVDGAGKEAFGASRALGKKIICAVDTKIEKRKARNIVGWVPARGPRKTDEYVIVGAHHDGLGRGTGSSLHPKRRGEVHNGADDNASGAAGIIALARRLVRRADRLDRSVLLVTFAAEERGLLGSQDLSRRLKTLPRPKGLEEQGPLKPVAMVNLDMIGRLRDRKLMISGVATSDDWPAVLAATKLRLENTHAALLELLFDRKEDLFGTSDHLSFYQAGLPVIFFFTGSHKEYHSPDDDLYRTLGSGERERVINIDGTAQTLEVVAGLVEELAAAPKPPAYKSGVDLAPRMTFKAVLRLMPDYGAQVEGMRVAEVSAGGPAERAGLRSGDVILRFGALSVRSVRDYMVGLEQAKPGEEIEVEYVRDGEKRTLKVKPLATGSAK